MNSQFCSSKWIPAFAGMTGGFSFFRGELRGIFCGEFRRFFRIPPRRRPILADKFPPPRRHSRERGNPFSPINPVIPAVVEKRGEFAVLFLKMDSRVRGNDGGFFLFSGGIAGDFLRRIPPFFRNSAPPPPDSRRRIPALPLSFPRTRESIFTDKFPSFPPLWKNEVNSQFCSSKWIPAFAGMTGGFSCFRGELRGIFCGEFRRFFRFPPPAAVRFLPTNSRLPAVIPANAGIHFRRQMCYTFPSFPF